MSSRHYLVKSRISALGRLGDPGDPETVVSVHCGGDGGPEWVKKAVQEAEGTPSTLLPRGAKPGGH